jgi:membrane protein implicated in regulation of membrane protease activity
MNTPRPFLHRLLNALYLVLFIVFAITVQVTIKYWPTWLQYAALPLIILASIAAPPFVRAIRRWATHQDELTKLNISSDKRGHR